MTIQDLAAHIDSAGFKIDHNAQGKIIVEGYPRVIEAWDQFNYKNPDVSCTHLDFRVALQFIADLQNAVE